MKFMLSFTLSILILSILIPCIPINGEENIYQNMVRLHVIANSDSDDDQALKLKVRDAVISVMENNFNNNDSVDTAKSKIESKESEIIKRAEEVIHQNGYDYDVKIEFGKELYPTREYEGFTLPCGEYTSLRVIIGSGEGKNWWCVLFPPLCLSGALGEEDKESFISAGFTPEQYKLITEDKNPKYVVKFKLIEIFSKLIESFSQSSEVSN